MKKQVDLLHGKIVSSLTELALPIMGTAAVQMAYRYGMDRPGGSPGGSVRRGGRYVHLAVQRPGYAG